MSFGNILVRSNNKINSKVLKVEDIKQKNDSKKSNFNISLPNIDDILAKEGNLESIKEADRIKKDIDKIQSKWANINNNDKYSQDIESIKKQISQLEKSVKNIQSLNDVKHIATTTKTVSSDIKSLKSNLTNIYKEYQKDKTIINKYIKSIKTLSSKDFNNLKDKYSFDKNGAINFVETHISKSLGEYSKLALKYYTIIKPYIKNDNKTEKEEVIQGKWVTYKERTPYPFFVIRDINALLNIKDLHYSLDIKHISSNQKKYKKTMKARLSGTDKQYKKLILDYEHNSMKEESIGTLKLNIDSYKIKSYKLKSDLVMKDMNINSKGLGYIKGLQTIKLDINTDIKEVLFKYQKSDSSINKTIYEILKNINSFDININLKGDIKTPSISINSNLDKKISKGLSKILDKERKKFEAKLKLKLQDKLKQYIGDIDIDSFNSLDSVLKNKLTKSGGLNDILSKINNNNNKFKNKIENKVKKKLGNMLKSLF